MSLTRYLLRAAKDPRTAISAEAALAYGHSGVFGSNVGNLLFADSVHRLLSTPDNDVVADSYVTEKYSTRRHIARIDREFDHFVIPLANAFRRRFLDPLRRLTEVIEGLTIPVTVVGVGAQFGIERDTILSDDIEVVVTRFARAVLDHSAKIGVRGDQTRLFLRRLGFGDEHVEVIGCPAVYLRGPENTVVVGDAPTPDSGIAMSISPYAKQVVPFVRRTLDTYRNAVYFPQNHTDLALMLWGEDLPGKYDPVLPTHTRHVLYREGRMRFPLDSRTWVDSLSEFDYAVGTRIHGTIAALLSRTPATILPFDSRTLELAEYHEIPRHKLATAGRKATVESLFAESDWSAYNRGLKPRFETLMRFFDVNGLTHIGQDGSANPAYEEQVAAAPFREPVRPLVPASPRYETDIADRVRWLRHRTTAAGIAAERTVRPSFSPLGYRPGRQQEPEVRRQLRAVVAGKRGEEAQIAALTAELDRRVAGGGVVAAPTQTPVGRLATARTHVRRLGRRILQG
ncbi:polysaccharide pyruvyl transferase family protein [Microbacterium horticulturae]|uniref:Polysaccharide pyruvyl transferase family protein n=1 Tax=Microbacterium horticulturae TaxID=3028316 RepID=A0ABY8BUQ6_9MICO|nr:polysaccharide pyruvyl transferase family protein [Microbacterium sp. KACC 23027]WEG07914.1 polysaccharide pyruvyl transferase family protein [Microbacterium sp. KACC 23027]